MTRKPKRRQKIFIEPLEQRIMLDGAGASTFLDVIDERNQQEIKKNSKIIDASKDNNELPFANVARDQSRKSVVFIDSAVPDFETIINSFKKNTEFYLINSNEDGFKKIQEILTDRKDIDALHIIGHGSAGQILFGNAFLNNQTINDYQATLTSIGQSLTTSGDILFYGCNVASSDQGELLIKKISEITKADIAASDDITGKSGDWELEKKIGIVETQNVYVRNYDFDLANGVTSTNSNVIENHSATNFKQRSNKGTNDHPNDRFIITLEKENIVTNATIRADASKTTRMKARPDPDYMTSGNNNFLNNSANPLRSYMFYLNNDVNRRAEQNAGEVTFDAEIIAVFGQGYKTIDNTAYSMVSGKYEGKKHESVSGKNRGRDVETASSGNSYDPSDPNGTSAGVNKGDWYRVSNNNRTITFGADNANPGDFLRILTRMPESNTAPVARDVTTAVNENVQQAESSDKDVAVSSDDADGDTLSITKVVYRDQNDQIKTSTLTANTWNFLYSKYGRLLIHSGTGRYFYDASSTNSDYDAGTQGLSANTSSFNRVNELDAGDSASETFTYTLSDGTDTDTGTITVNITGINDDPIAANDQNTIEEGGTIARSSTEDERSLLNNDTDVDGDDDKSNFKVLLAKKGNSEQEGESTPTDWTEGNLNQTTRPSATIRGNYGSLTIYYDGTYTYTADSQIAGLDSGETVSDYFNYLVSDDSNGYEPNIPQDTRSVPNNQNSYAVLQITITGVDDPAVNAAPSVTNDTAYVYEDFTVTALDGASANDGFSTSPFIGLNAISADSDYNSAHGDHTGDLLANDTDSDGDTLTITGVRQKVFTDPFQRIAITNPWTDVGASASVDTSTGQTLTGDYGTLSIGADGSFSYAATADATDALDLNDTVADTFEYRVSDGTDVATGTLTVTVKGINDLPEGVNDTDAVTAGSSISRSNDSDYDVLVDDTDVDGDDNHTGFTIYGISIGGSNGTFSDGSATINGTYGTLTINTNGSYSYDTSSNSNALALANGATASDVFTYAFYDNDGSSKLTAPNALALTTSPSETATLTITVTGQTPQTTNDTGYIAAGSTLTVDDGDGANDADTSGDYNDATGDHTGDILENDTGTSITVTAIESATGETGSIGSALTGAYGELTLNANGSYTYNANNASSLGASETATDVFTYTVTDSDSGGTGTATITITVLGSNDAPIAADDTGYIYENSTLTTDVENGATLGTDTDDNNESGDNTGEFLLNDSDVDGDTITITSIRHTGGTLSGSSISTNEDADTATTRTDITASTTYLNGSSVTGDYGTLTIGADGSYTYVANSANDLDDGDTGTDIFTYTLSDGSLTDTATLTITVEGINDAPVAQDDHGFINENSTLTVSDGDNATTDTTTTNLTSKTLTDSLTTGDLYGQDIRFNGDGTKIFKIGVHDDKIFEYSLGTAYDISTINATASAVSGVPGVVVSDAITNLGSGFTFNSDGTKLFAIAGGNISEFALGTAYDISTLNETATDTYNPSITGLRSMSFNSDGTKLLVTRHHATDENVVQFSLATGYDLSSINYDGGVALSISNVRGLALSGDGTKMFISNQGTGRIIQYSLATAFSVNDGVTYDGEFTANVTSMRGLTFNDDGSKIYYIDMLANNRIKSYDLGENYRVWNFANTGTTGESTGDLIDTNSSIQTDSDKDDSASLTISAIRTGTEAAGTGTSGTVGSSLTGTYGTLTVQSTGAYTYVANLAATEALDTGDVALDYFTYTLSDGTATDTAQLTIKVTGINDTPTATDDTGYIAEGSTLTVADGGAAVSGTSTGSNSGDLLDNDTDVDVTADTAGNVTESSDDALTVTGTVSQNGGTNTSGGSVSSNSQTASVGSAVTGLYGSLTINSDGSYSYVANNAEAVDVGETVTDIFTYTITDSQSATDTVTLTITIIGTNDLPTSADATVYVNENNTDSSYGERTPSANYIKTFASSDFSFTDADTSDSSLSAIKIVTLPSSGTLTLSGTAVSADDEIATASISSLVYTPTANSESDDSFTFKVSDGTGFSSSANTMTISNNAAPVVTDKTIETAVVDNGGTSTGTVHDFVADSDDADSVLVVTGVAAGNESTNSSIISDDTGVGSAVTGTYGTLNIAANGIYTYTSSVDLSPGDSAVTDTFTYTTRDDETNTDENYAYDTGTITFTVVPSLTLVDDTDTVTAGNTVTVNDGDTEDLLEDDVDAGGNSLTVSNISFTDSSDNTTTVTVTSGGVIITGLYGELTIYENGSYSYTPNQSATTSLAASETGTDVFTYTATNGTDSGNATLTFTVTGINDAPTSSNATIYINENNQYSSAGDRTSNNITYTFSDSDFAFADDDTGDAITHVKIASLPLSGTLAYSSTDLEAGDLPYSIAIADIGNLVYTPTANSESDDSFTFNVSDGTTDSASANTISISLNAAPAATNHVHASSVATGGTASSNLVLDVSGVDTIDDSDDESDSSSHVLTISGVASGAESSTIPSGNVGSAVTGTYGSLVLNSDGSYTYTANPTNDITLGGTDTDVFNYAVQDDEGTTGSAGSNALDVGQLTFTVQAEANSAPTAANGTIYVNENNEVSSAGDRTPSNISHTFDESEFSLTDVNEAAGQTLSIKIVTLPTSGTLAYNSTDLTSSDVDPDTSTTYTIAKTDIGNLVYTPTANSESDDSFTFKAYDGVTDSTSTYTITVTNNAAPNVTDTTVAGTVAAGATTSSADIHDIVADSDDDESVLVVTGVAAGDETTNNTIITDDTGIGGDGVDGTYGTLTMAADGTYTYTADTPNDIAYGATDTDTFTFTTRDDETNSGSFAYDVGTITFTVGSSISLEVDTDTVDEDGDIDTVAEGVDGVLVNDDADTDGLVVTTVTSNNTLDTDAAGSAVTGEYGILILAADGSYTYDTSGIAATDALTAGEQVTDVFTYEADGGATTTLTITVTGLGPLAVNDTGAVDEDATVEGSAGLDGDGVLGNDDGDASKDIESLRVTRVSTDNFSTATTVDDDDNADTIDGTYGTLTIYKTGQYSYTPDNATAQAITKDTTVTETFYYEIKDDNDVNASTATLVFTITGQNDDITAVDDTDSVDEGASVIRGNTSTNSLDYNDTDADSGNTYATHQITAIRLGDTEDEGEEGTIGEPLKGTYGRITVFADGSYIYQANNNILDSENNRITSGDTVTDTFNYTVSDTDGGTDTAVITITISGTNEAPLAATDYAEIDADGSSISKTPSTGVTSNDADIEGADLTVNGIRTGGEDDTGTTGTIGSPLEGSYGSLTMNSDGSYTYELDTTNENLAKIPAGHGFYEIFTYTVTDDTGQTSTAEIVIRINGVNDAPTAVDDSATLDLDTSPSLNNLTNTSNFVNANDVDVDLFDDITIDAIRTGQSGETGTSITVGQTYASTYGNFYIQSNGGYAFTANDDVLSSLKPGEKVYEYFTYTITDSAGLTASAQLSIEIFGSSNVIETETEITRVNILKQEQALGFQNLIEKASFNEIEKMDVIPERVPFISTNFYDGQIQIASFNENLKLVDLRAQFKDKDGNYTTFSGGSPDDILALQFSVFNDPGIELVRYKGEMKDGSALPDWIKVNPKTGIVVTDIPPDIDILEFNVIGIDEANNEYQISVAIDAGELRSDRELAQEFAGEIDENISVDADGEVEIQSGEGEQNISVDENGDVEVQSDEEQTNNENENNSTNGNEAKIKSKKPLNYYVKGEVFSTTPSIKQNKYVINLPDEIKNNLAKGVAVLTNGEKAPKWVKVNLTKGELVLDPPKNINQLDFTILTMDQDGNRISNDIKTTFNKNSIEKFAIQSDIKNQDSFVAFTDQIRQESAHFDTYGEDFLKRI